MSTLPTYVQFRNWEPGDPKNAEIVLDLYKVWDENKLADATGYFADTTNFDLPDGRRLSTTKSTIETTFGKLRKSYKQTINVPFSIMPLYNKDMDQQWVIAWIWNKWQYTDGVRDSMLYCDNWRFSNGKIDHMVSMENKPSKLLSGTLSKKAVK